MSDKASATIIVTTSLVAFLSGFALGVYSIRGYFISPELAKERRENLTAPTESDESDIDEDDSILDHAPNWANGEQADKRDGLRAKPEEKGHRRSPSGPAPATGNTNEECKLVLVVRTDLGMTKGKIAAQCGHATLGCYKALLHASQNGGLEARTLLRRWENGGQAKIAVQVKSQDEIMALRAAARAAGVTAEVVADAGRTQIAAGSLTVLGVGPAPKSIVDKITGHLKLL